MILFKIKILKNGFSLIETLVVISIITVLLITTIVIVNPARQIALARDNVRESHISQIWQAVNRKYVLAGEWDCSAGQLPHSVNNGAPVFKYIGTAVGEYDLFSCIYPSPISNILVDPSEGVINDGVNDYSSKYEVWQHPVTKRISIRAPHAEVRTLALGTNSDEQIVVATTNILQGWAWSENIGFLSVNADTGGGSVDYGGNILESDDVSGYAWQAGTEGESGGLGWVKFDASPYGGESYPTCPIGICPNGSPNYSTQINWETGKITGWARFCSGTANGDCNSASRSDWDGWVLLGPINIGGQDYGLSVNENVTPTEITGWAYASEPVGWISFNCSNTNICAISNYKVNIIEAHPTN